MSIPRWFLWLVAAAIIMTALHVGRSFLIPVAIALLMFTLLSALIGRITRIGIAGWSVPRPVATVVGLAVVAYGLFLISSILTSQVEAVVAASPRYINRFQEMLNQTAELFGRDVVADLQRMVAEINITARLAGFVGSAGAIVAIITLIVLYMGFMLVERPMFHAKLTRLFPEPDRAERIETVILSISESIQRYFSVKLFTSALTAGTAYLVMKPMGLDFAETWALLAFFLNFIPNIGSVIATILPALVALVQFDSFGPFLVIAIGVSAVQFTIGSFIEPALMGRSLNLSPLVIILSLTFWASVWGVVGMFLSVPIMVIALIVCSHIPAWRPFAVILSKDGNIPESSMGG